MIKTFGGIIIILSFTYLGFVYAQEIKLRVKQLKEFENGIYILKCEMLYTYTSLPDAFESLSIKSKGEVKNVFQKISNLLFENKVNDVYEAFKLSLVNNKNLKLKSDDIDILLNLGKNLGKSDLDGQESILLFTIENLKKQINELEELMNKKIKMYRCLGFSIGAMLVIMLI